MDSVANQESVYENQMDYFDCCIWFMREKASSNATIGKKNPRNIPFLLLGVWFRFFLDLKSTIVVSHDMETSLWYVSWFHFYIARFFQ